MKKDIKFRRAVLVIVVLVALAGIHLFINTQNISLKYKLTDLKTEYSKIHSRNQELGSQVAEKEDLHRIEQAAREKLNMAYPDQVNYVLASKEATD
ncbi:hypothetical protein A3H38_02025 [candidate division WOR-1 bacterium RIFCSPLOWO2_02_FULL_46_20]|uniref:Cell division protein FtsL n=2 Tax=Saganbacteria TaxID=1703751 RepID=A0A1F4R898_UNCSA|nr:MAG: hypothetical protein A3J44_05535 [candidate division WOR-1 bacterium RIFCSPHIGHO2_02_FULL_45_12]OGC04455.1 MAG: hypothetical protein A3H38_02025 [candidate division WOR-1 bacterium RIFCSPLOWO2_02_FULL_46_20]OGC09607.1 MAG: hypothetical protein A3F86_06400 [candidate division WOR-1 bacterium RIFCSPLOWO2_12_FULL_45_9]